MDKIIESVFKNADADFAKLIAYGFCENNGSYNYQTLIADTKMRLVVLVDKNGCVTAEVYDDEAEDIYTLFLADDAVGAFVGKIRKEYEIILRDICKNCFVTEIFKSTQAKAIIAYVAEKYGDELEFLWQKVSENAVWRRSDNRKWYGALLKVSKRKLGLNSDQTTEIIDLRVDSKNIDNIIDNVKYFSGYHMNKKHWLTIILDGSLSLNEICSRIDESYLLAKKK